MNQHEVMFAREFIIPEKRDRYVSLMGSVKGRKKIVAGFHHIRDLDTRYAKLIPSNQQSGESIYRLLKQKGAPGNCYIMSDDLLLIRGKCRSARLSLKSKEPISEHWFLVSLESWRTLKRKV